MLLLSEKFVKRVQPIETEGFTDLDNGGGNFFELPFRESPFREFSTGVISAPVSQENKIQFDFSVLQGLRPSDKFRGNVVSEIYESGETYRTGNPIGRGGQYAIDAARRFGISVTDAAKSYLQNAGIPIISDIVDATDATEKIEFKEFEERLEDFFELPFENFEPKEVETRITKTPLEEIIQDVLPALFGRSPGGTLFADVPSEPLESQAYGYIPETVSAPSGSNIWIFLVIGAVAIGGYFLYKKYKG